MSQLQNNIRTFIAFKLPDHVKKSLKEAQRELAQAGFKAKYIATANMHLTLKFIGDMDSHLIPKIGDALKECAEKTAPISLTSKGIGVFPNIRFPRVIWAGIGGELEPLEALHACIDRRLGGLGLPEEHRKFQGHLTLARLKDGKADVQKLKDALDKLEQFESKSFTADKLILLRSQLKPDGPTYTELLSVPLGQGA